MPLVRINGIGVFNVLRAAGNRVQDRGTLMAVMSAMVRLAVIGMYPGLPKV